MKIMPRLLFFITAFGAALLVGGCDTFDSRAKEKSTVFNSLSTKTQERLELGKINVGDTQDMVYIALGDPDEKRVRTTANGEQSIWIYKTYLEQYEGTVWAGWRRTIAPGPNGRGYIVYHEPISQDVYRTRVDEVIRITFSDGKVTIVEQQKP